MRNAEVPGALADPAWATEMGQFNLEINVPARRLDGDALADLERDIRADLNAGDTTARPGSPCSSRPPTPARPS